MPRPTIDIEPFRDEIEQRFRDNAWNTAQAIAWLRANGVSIKPTAFKKRLRDWGVAIKPQRPVASEQSEAALRATIEELFWTWDIDDDMTYRILNIEGHSISLQQYRRLRRSLGLKRRIAQEEQPDHNANITEVLTDVLAGGALDDFGYRNLAREIRRDNHLIGR